VNQVQALAEALALPTGAIAVNWDKNYVPFPYWPPSAHFGRILSGQAVLSRYPIQANQRIELARVPTKPFYYNALYLDRLAQVTQVEINGRPLILINVHLEAFDAPTRLGQTQVVRDLAIEYAREYPVILLGDFNSAVNRTGHPEEGDSPSISLLRQTDELAPTVPPAQWSDSAQLTYPSDTPQYKLDYIFYTPKTLELLSSRVVSEAAQASDHLPIAATFRFRSP
jgi:endonuclease/exonuclease/phosphatase family metal-dependent hydrolase